MCNEKKNSIDICNINHTSNKKISETHGLNIDIINNNLISSFDNITIDDNFFIESSILNISIHDEVNKLNIGDELEELNKLNENGVDEKEIDFTDELDKLFELDELTEQNELKKDTVSSNYLDSTFYNIFQKDIYKSFYERPEQEEIYKSSNFNNQFFCHYCKNYLVLAEAEIALFLNLHITLNKNYKYLILVFRLCPNIFLNYDIMMNKYLRRYIFNYLNLSDETFYNNADKYFYNIIILNQYFSIINKSTNSHIFENLFHQPNLKYEDYLKCDSCKNYMCPKHMYLSNCYFAKCKICKSNNWTICGWCKPNFNEEYACEYIHNKL
jgi:hypothetical protein